MDIDCTFHNCCAELRNKTDQPALIIKALETIYESIERSSKNYVKADNKTCEWSEGKREVCVCVKNGGENCTMYFISFILKADADQFLRFKHNQNNLQNTSKPNIESKERLQALVDKLSKWIWSHPMSEVHLSAFQHCITSVHEEAGIRKQICEKVLSWITKKGLEDDGYSASLFPTLQKLLMLIATDIWSAIRSVYIKRLGRIVQLMSLDQVQQLFGKFVEKTTKEHQWQARDGSIMAISIIVQQFKIKPILQCSEQMFLQFGKTDMEALPDFLKLQMQVVIFRLLADSQLAIREHAIQAYVPYLHRSPHTVKDEAWKSLTQHLANYSPSEGKKPHMDAYEAEGFLGVCDILIKHISTELLLDEWKTHFIIFSQYLGHSASTVRQAASKIFKHIVCQVNSVIAVTKTLLDLGRGWSVINHDEEQSVGQDAVVYTWEQKEGRMLTYELILTHILTNHYMYAFGGPSVDFVDAGCREPSTLHADATPVCSLHKFSKPDGHNHHTHQIETQKRRYSFFDAQHADKDVHKLKHYSSELDLNQARKHDVLKHQKSTKTCPGCLSLLMQAINGSHVAVKTEKYLYENLFIEALRVILNQTIQCLADEQWELQRIGQQVLPMITEVIQWSCSSVLDQVLTEHLEAEASPMCYAACLLMHHTLHHSSKIANVMTSNSLSASKLLQQKLQQMVSSTSDLLERHVETIELLLQRPVCDKVSVTAMENIMTSHIISSKQSNLEQSVQSACIVQQWLQIYTNAHPEQSFSPDLTELVDSDVVLEISGAKIISCLTKHTENPLLQVLQAEKYMLTVLSGVLVAWLQQTGAGQACQLLPVLASYLAIYQDHDLISKVVLNGLDALIKSTVAFLDKEPDTSDEATKMEREAATEMMLLCIQALSSNLLLKDLNVSVMRHSMERYTQLFERFPSSTAFHHLVQATHEKYGSKLLSPDTKRADTQQGLSAAAAAGLQQDNEDEAGSDWDSWDEDEGDDPQVTKNVSTEMEILGHLVKHIKTHVGEGVFSTYLHGLSTAELQLLKDLLDR